MNKEICQLCDSYSTDTECEHQDTCKINAVVKENEKLKEENKRLKKQLGTIKNEMSYLDSPLSIGDRHEMGG